MAGHVIDDLAAYAEDQLEAATRARVDAHLQSCAACRGALDEVRRGVALASHLERTTMPADVAARIRRAIGQAGPARRHSAGDVRGRWWQAAAAAIVVIAGTAMYWQINRPWVRLHAASAPPTAFERDGRALHDRVASGAAPLAFTSSDEQALWHWLASQGAPVTSMRIERPAEDGTRFVPIGAAVHTLGGARTSVVEYRIDGRAVTLALAESHTVPDAPAAGWWTKRVMHRRDANGVNTLAWTVGSGTYVMVSELDGAGQRACLICHSSPRFRDRLDELGR